MSVYQHKDSPFYHFDFQHKGCRFHGSTGCTNKREAEAFERAERDRAKQAVRLAASPSTQLDYVIGRYWDEVGQRHVGADTTWRDLERLLDYFKPNADLAAIGDDQVSRLVAWRRGQRVTIHRKRPVKNAPLPRFIAPATVNRSTTEVLKKLFTRAKAWGVRFDKEPEWKRHWLLEPQERVRELKSSEATKLDDATRDDYRPIMDFASASGLRLTECLLRWSEIDWDSKRIEKQGKNKKRVTAPITPVVRSILWPLRGHHDEFVFTYIAKRTRKAEKLVRGQRYPITRSGLKTAWRRLRAASGVKDFRFHDKRHDFATKLLRDSKNLKVVQKALGHASITTTTKYAHVADDEVAAAIEAMQKSRKKSRTHVRKVS
jgi:integrase